MHVGDCSKKLLSLLWVVLLKAADVVDWGETLLPQAAGPVDARR